MKGESKKNTKGEVLHPKLPPIHPGEILRDKLLKPLNISITKLARDLKVSEKEIKSICEAKTSITSDLASRLSIYFDTSTEL